MSTFFNVGKLLNANDGDSIEIFKNGRKYEVVIGDIGLSNLRADDVFIILHTLNNLVQFDTVWRASITHLAWDTKNKKLISSIDIFYPGSSTNVEHTYHGSELLRKVVSTIRLDQLVNIRLANGVRLKGIRVEGNRVECWDPITQSPSVFYKNMSEVFIDSYRKL